MLALCAVFIPVSFLGGLAGELYRQFAVTISVSVIISGIVALTLTPALGAIFLQQQHREVMAPFRVFNRGFDWLTLRFTQHRRLLPEAHVPVPGHRRRDAGGDRLVMFFRVPGGLLPDEDQGYNMLVTMLPPASSLERSRQRGEDGHRRRAEESRGRERVLDGRLRRAVVRAEDLIRASPSSP